MDLEKLLVGGLIFVLLGGSFLAATWAVEAAWLPVAGLLYLLVGLLFASRLRRARKGA
jgi:CHASE2 domain-containing sensor protein